MDGQLILDARSAAELSLREWMQSSGRAWVQLSTDAADLAAISKRPDLLLQRLAKRDVLIALGGGAYILPGSDPLAAIHARMQQLGDYFVSYRTGMIERGWIEGGYGNVMTIAVPGNHISRPKLRLGSRTVEITRMTGDDRWFGSEMVSCVGGWYVRADAERLLLDLLDRPKISGSVVEIRDVWAKALTAGVDLDRLSRYAIRFGYSMTRRTGWWLEQFGFTAEADALRPHKGQSGAVWLDAAQQYPKHAGGWNVDKQWGVKINLPNDVWHGAVELIG